MSKTIPKKEFEKRARALGAINFRKEGRDWKLTFYGVDITYMVTHGKRKKGNEVPIGGPSGIDHVANEMAKIAKWYSLPYPDDPQYFKKVLKGYEKLPKRKTSLDDLLLISVLSFIAYLLLINLIL